MAQAAVLSVAVDAMGKKKEDTVLGTMVYEQTKFLRGLPGNILMGILIVVAIILIAVGFSRIGSDKSPIGLLVAGFLLGGLGAFMAYIIHFRSRGKND